MTENKTCGTCKFSRTEKFYDEIADAILISMKRTFEIMEDFDREKVCHYNITKCHLQGAPQQVNPDKDWCYKWEEDT